MTPPDTPPPLPASETSPATGGKALLALLLLPWGLAGAAGILLGAGIDLAAWVDKASPGCFFYKWTGLSCPGCGGTRATIDILHGDILHGLAHNWFWLPSIFILGFEYLQAWRRYLGKEYLLPSLHIAAMQTYAVSVILWFIIRNIIGI